MEYTLMASSLKTTRFRTARESSPNPVFWVENLERRTIFSTGANCAKFLPFINSFPTSPFGYKYQQNAAV
jgi:hypothetical protein